MWHFNGEWRGGGASKQYIFDRVDRQFWIHLAKFIMIPTLRLFYVFGVPESEIKTFHRTILLQLHPKICDINTTAMVNYVTKTNHASAPPCPSSSLKMTYAIFSANFDYFRIPLCFFPKKRRKNLYC